MKSLFRRSKTPQPLLAPLATAGRLSRLTQRASERMPAAVLPVAVTIVGGIAVLALIGMLSGGDADSAATTAASVPVFPREGVAAPVRLEVAEEEAAAETASDLVLTAEPEQQTDPARTASILPALLPGARTLMPPVPVAETEAEIAALEEAQRRDVEADVGAPPPQETASSMRPARANRHVNLRAGPDDAAQVLLVVPAQAEMKAEDDCGWCEVVYQGSAGYIYRSFIDYVD